MKRIVLLGMALLALSAPRAVAQDQYVELLRQDLRTEKTAVVTEAMMLTPEQGELFWPVYRDYDNEVAKLGDERLALIRKYAENYRTMDDAMADEIVQQAMKLNESRMKLRAKYYKKMKKEVGAVVAARFSQVDAVIQNLVDLQIAAELPLIQQGE